MAIPEFIAEEIANEEWRVLPGISGYEVSSLGRVRSLRKRLLSWRGGRYASVTLQKRQFSVHALVAAAFLCGPRSPKTEVNHKDTNRRNNRADNLEYCTRKGNMEHAAKMGLMPSGQYWLDTHMQNRPRGENHFLAKFTDDEIRQIRADHAAGTSQRALARRWKVHRNAIRCIIRFETWKHVK